MFISSIQLLLSKELFHQPSFQLSIVLFIYPASPLALKPIIISSIQLLIKQRSFHPSNIYLAKKYFINPAPTKQLNNIFGTIWDEQSMGWIVRGWIAREQIVRGRNVRIPSLSTTLPMGPSEINQVRSITSDDIWIGLFIHTCISLIRLFYTYIYNLILSDSQPFRFFWTNCMP